MKKKLIIFFLVLAAALGIAQVGLAYSINSIVHGEKQLLADGNMEASGTGSWVALRNAALVKTVVGQHSGKQALRVTNVTPDTNPAAYQSLLMTTGKVYRLTGFARGDGVNGIPAVSTQDAAPDWLGTNSTSWQRFDITVKARAAYTVLYDKNNVTGYTEFDDVTVTLYPGKIQNQEKNLLADGNMEASGTGSWTAVIGSPTISKTTSGTKSGKQALSFLSDGLNRSLINSTTLTDGKTYRITGWAKGDGTNSPAIYTKNGTVEVWSGTTSATWQRFNVVFTGNTNLRFYNIGYTGQTVYFDDVQVTEYAGKTQNTEKQLLVDGNMENSGVASWTADNSILSKQTTNPHSGNQVLRIGWISGSTALAERNIFTLGKRYRITGWARGDGTGAPGLSLQGGASPWYGTSSPSWQRFDTILIPTSDTWLYLNGTSLSATHYVEFDDVMLTEVP